MKKITKTIHKNRYKQAKRNAKMAEEHEITLTNGNKVRVYTSKLRGTAINAADCQTKYRKTKANPNLYEPVKK